MRSGVVTYRMVEVILPYNGEPVDIKLQTYERIVSEEIIDWYDTTDSAVTITPHLRVLIKEGN